MKIVIISFLFLLLAFPAHALDLLISTPSVNSNEVTVAASLSGTTNNYYLQGLLRSVESSKYFGETKNNRGAWIDYLSSPDKDYITNNFFLTEVINASWSGQLNLRFKSDDLNYKGPGAYEVKLRRFTGNGSSSAGESNTLIVNLSLPLPPSSPPPAPPPPSPSPSPVASPSPSVKPSPSPLPSLNASLAPEGTVAGALEIDLSAFNLSPTPEASPLLPNPPLSLNRERARIAIIIGAGLLLSSLAGFLGYQRYRQHKLDAL